MALFLMLVLVVPMLVQPLMYYLVVALFSLLFGYLSLRFSKHDTFNELCAGFVYGSSVIAFMFALSAMVITALGHLQGMLDTGLGFPVSLPVVTANPGIGFAIAFVCFNGFLSCTLLQMPDRNWKHALLFLIPPALFFVFSMLFSYAMDLLFMNI